MKSPKYHAVLWGGVAGRTTAPPSAPCSTVAPLDPAAVPPSADRTPAAADTTTRNREGAASPSGQRLQAGVGHDSEPDGEREHYPVGPVRPRRMTPLARPISGSVSVAERC